MCKIRRDKPITFTTKLQTRPSWRIKSVTLSLFSIASTEKGKSGGSVMVDFQYILRSHSVSCPVVSQEAVTFLPAGPAFLRAQHRPKESLGSCPEPASLQYHYPEPYLSWSCVVLWRLQLSIQTFSGTTPDSDEKTL